MEYMNIRTDQEIKFFDTLGVVVDYEIIDDLIMSDNNILRPVLGHAFEFIIEEIVIKKLGGSIVHSGGDSDIDLVIVDKYNRKHTCQIKTLNKSTIKEKIEFGVNLHKTHGLEKRPNNLYPISWPCKYCKHDGDAFPEFLIIPHPDKGILIIPKDSIPENRKHLGHFADPALFDWNSIWLNRWDLLGFNEFKGVYLERGKIEKQEFLTKVCEKVNLNFNELLSVWLRPANFRMISMNLRGNLREPFIINKLKQLGFKVEMPKGKYPKHDLIVNNKKIQVKGVSKRLFDNEKLTLGVEVMGTHGNGFIRRYSESDFDYLCVVIEPIYNKNFIVDSKNDYSFFFVPSKDLPLHYRNGFEWNTTNKLYDVAKFKIIYDRNKTLFIPHNEYSEPASFIKDGKKIKRAAVTFRYNNYYILNSTEIFKY